MLNALNWLVGCSVALAFCRVAGADVDFSRDIRPILSENCLQCHGTDANARKAGLRLDRRDGATAVLPSGNRAVVPGRIADSQLLARVTSADVQSRMPPAETEKRLAPRQIELLRAWIDQGAEWTRHWSFATLRRPELPQVNLSHWPKNSIDYFVLAQMERNGLQPVPDAAKSRLIRRVTLDLTGLPPTPNEVDSFLAYQTPGAFERVVDRLLASPRYGERMAQPWLDLARYADTDGYQDDEPRVMWRWRDWVIDALNDNMPYDQFTIEQLAGDLLPNAQPRQILATGFLRNNRTNGEGGSIEEEFRVEYAVDRIDTTSTVWLGLTFACARCHDHKYDPITQRDFYRLFAFFNRIPEKGTYRRNSPPLIKVPTPVVQWRLDEIDRRLSDATLKQASADALRKERERLLESVPTTMVMQDGPARETFVLIRGQYDNPGQKVLPGLPRFFVNGLDDSEQSNRSVDSKDAIENATSRLDLARWLTDPAHPLTARVTANRIWQIHFGTGLVKTAEDFGVQGQPPSHPRLLDWLATELIDKQWNAKEIHRMILSSATYRQSSKIPNGEIKAANGLVRTAPPESLNPLSLDLDNRLLSRGPRFRLPAEAIRDQALSIGGLLIERIGGPSVKPPQPPGLWKEIAGGASGVYANGYQPDEGASRYRRSIYTFWRRTIPPPSMVTFDAPSREACITGRPRTNTPLQALAMLNETTFVEASKGLGNRMILEGGWRLRERLTYGFRLALSRKPTDDELRVLLEGWQDYHEHYLRDSDAARVLVDEETTEDDELINMAAFTAVAGVLLNLDEVVNME